MDIGTLDRQVTIETKSVTRDADFGSEVIAWVELGGAGNGTVWARRADIADIKRGGSESVRADERVAALRTDILMRWRADVTTAMRVRDLDRGDTLQVISMAEEGRREGLRLICEAFQ